MRLYSRALVGAVTMVMVSMGAAQAATGSPPVAVDDAVTVTVGRPAQPDVLANDSDPDGDKLVVCRVSGVPAGVHADVIDGRLTIFGLEPGTYSFTYYACDYSYLTPATVTVTVKAPPPVHLRVRKSDRRPGRLHVTNWGDFRLRFQWGSYKHAFPDGHVSIPAHTGVWVKVRRVSLIWIASNYKRGAFRLGIVRGITLPQGADALPPGAPSSDGSFSFVYASRWGVSPS
ncbi:MAG TPA: Ig-like domain-containing protein [Nocardioides sp.]|nr:Ig-like domain-containing protein [Nocardioides sp.]